MTLLTSKRFQISLTNNGFLLSALALVWVFGSINSVLAGDKDDPLLAKLMIDQLELADADGSNPTSLAAQAWLGKDLNKLWLKADLERAGNDTEQAQLQALYSRAVAPYWDLQLGVRKDFQPTPSRHWAVIGLQGLAPYYFEIDSALYIGESGRSAFRLELEYELLFSQRLILTPELEVNFYAQNDAELGLGSGLSDVEAGLRLRYEIRREFAPYIGVSWHKRYGNSADFARSAGHEIDETQWVMGVRAWF